MRFDQSLRPTGAYLMVNFDQYTHASVFWNRIVQMLMEDVCLF